MHMRVTEIFKNDLFKDHVVFVTGGGSCINLGIAKTVAALGAKLGICGRTEAKLESAKAELEALGAEVYTGACDVRDSEALAKVIEGCKEALGPIHTLICGAAGNFPCPANAISPNGFKSVIDIDLLGSFNACHAAFEQLSETKGNVIFISAGQSMYAYALQAHVGAAKAGIDQMMRNMALEWGPHGIRCNSLAPGPIKVTEGMKRLAPPGSEGHIAQAIPLQRLGTPEDMGEAAAFLASPLASYVTGTTLMADGGQNLPGSGLLSKILMDAMAGA